MRSALWAVLGVLLLVGGLCAAPPAAQILTPKPGPQPRINSPRVFGVRPGSPVLYTIAATGKRPMRFSADGLPRGLKLDPAAGRISGTIPLPGNYEFVLRAENDVAKTERRVRFVVGDQIMLTPLLGCNTWGGWGPKVTEANLRSAAEAMVKSDLINHGWQYINIDDGWQGRRGGPHNAIQPNEKFADMKGLCEYIHSLGLKAGIYSTPYVTSYAGFVGGSSDDPRGAWQPEKRRKDPLRSGKYFFETEDARQWAEWGFDYCKYDWGVNNVEIVRRMADALSACPRDMVFELSNSVPLAQAGQYTRLAHLSRTTGDLVDLWDRSQMDPAVRGWAVGIRDVWLAHNDWVPYQRPGHWNFACNLRIGLLGGWRNKPLAPSRLTPDEQYAHISLWCLWGSPMIIGTPIDRLDEFTLSLLSNDEVLEIEQDPLGRQARPVEVRGGESLVKNLDDGSTAVGLFNVGTHQTDVSVRWSDLGLSGRQRVRDLWRQKDLGFFDQQFSARVSPHGVVLVRLWPGAGATGILPVPPAKLYQQAIKLEGQLELARATALYEQILRDADPRSQSDLRLAARQGLLRVDDLRSGFSLTRPELEKRVAQSYRGFQPKELDQWEQRGWIYSRPVDGKKLYSAGNPTNLRFFDTDVMARNPEATKGYRQFADLFLRESARLDRLRAESPVRQSHVDPVRMVFTVREEIRQADLPPGKVVRAWFPVPLLSSAIQNIRILSVSPAGSLKIGPDLESDIGIAYLEVPRPESGDLVIEMKTAFDGYHTDLRVDPASIPPYDTASELYRRFTRSEQQMELTPQLRELAASIVGTELNPYRKARKLYDWVCDHVTYNYVWHWRDATWAYGCASEEVRRRRIGDCVIQSVFYATLCRALGLPARVLNGPIFPPGLKNDHVWAEVYFPVYGWLPVDVTYSEVASMVPGLTPPQRRTIRDFFFGRMDRWRITTQRNDLAQDLVPAKKSLRRHVTMFVRPELECGGRHIEKHKASWECQPEK